MTNDEIKVAINRLQALRGKHLVYDYQVASAFLGVDSWNHFDLIDTLIELLKQANTKYWLNSPAGIDELSRVDDGVLTAMGLIRLPVDANGEVIHAGDDLIDDEGNCITVYQITYLEDGVLGYDEYGNEIDIAGCTIYREPTIEDVLDELEDMDSIGDRDAIVMRCRELAGILSELMEDG